MVNNCRQWTLATPVEFQVRCQPYTPLPFGSGRFTLTYSSKLSVGAVSGRFSVRTWYHSFMPKPGSPTSNTNINCEDIYICAKSLRTSTHQLARWTDYQHLLNRMKCGERWVAAPAAGHSGPITRLSSQRRPRTN